MNLNIDMRKLLIFCATLLSVVQSYGQKIDFDMTNRQAAEVLEDGYTSWAVSQGASESKTIDGITFTVAAAGNANQLRSQWSKNDVKSGKANLKLIGDAVAAFIADADNNTPNLTDKSVAISVTISGLSAGLHSIQAYHNGVNGYKDLAPINVSVNGAVVESNVKQSANAQTIGDAGMSYITVNAAEGQDVVVTYESVVESGATYGSTNVYLNGLILDETSTKFLASTPNPTDKDFHFDADTGRAVLQWTAAEGATRHYLYFSTDSTNLVEPYATTTEPQFEVFGLSHKKTYYWRVDEEIDGQVYTGTVWSFRPRHLAFPGAEGWGKWAIGGRNGSVYHVTTLDDNGDDENPVEGSLRYGIKKVSGPRTIVFDVSGIIHLKSRLTCSDKFVTIAGQTAPGKGIMLAVCPFGMASDGQTRFLRMGLGHKKLLDDGVIPGGHYNPDGSYGSEAGTSYETTLGGLDGMGMAGNDYSIMDHCSIMWTIDEAFSSRNAHSLTLQRTLISETLNQAGHPNYSKGTQHGYAATIGGGEMSAALSVGSYHHNLLVDNEGRNWSVSGGLDGGGSYDGHHDIFNNVVYNWGGRATDGGTHQLNFVNNYYKMGPATTQKILMSLDLEGTGKGTQSAYVSGNIRQAVNNGALTNDKQGDTYRYTLKNGQTLDWKPFVSEPFFESQATIESAKQAYKSVLSDVGANQPFFTNHDQRMVSETLAGTTTTKGSRSGKKGLIDSEEDDGCEGFDGLELTEEHRAADWDTDQDGMPDWWEKAVGTDPNVADNNGDTDGDGFTNLEDYLNWMACPHFELTVGEKTTIDMKEYFKGYNNKPSFTVSVDGGINVVDEGDGKYSFTITDNAKGQLATADVTATDADNVGSYTRTFNFYIPSGTTSIATMYADRSMKPSRYEVYDLAGQKVANKNDLTGLPAGTYIVKGILGGQTIGSYKTIVR